MVSQELREYAETPDRFAHVAPAGSIERFSDERVCIVQAPTWASISGIDVGEDELEALLAEIRARVREDKDTSWWIGPSTRPRDAEKRLRALGLGDPYDGVGLLHVLCLTREPAAVGEVEVSRIDTFDQLAAARELAWDAFGTPAERREKNRARLREEFEDLQRDGIPAGFLASIDGRPAGTAFAIPSDRGVFLIGGSTAPWARGRGVYRALVHARWNYAVARGTPALVTHAKPGTSYPILLRLGFEEVCTIHRLEDRTRD